MACFYGASLAYVPFIRCHWCMSFLPRTDFPCVAKWVHISIVMQALRLHIVLKKYIVIEHSVPAFVFIVKLQLRMHVHLQS